MDNRVARELVKVRKAVKRKFQALKADIIQSQFEREREFAPIIKPLNELLAEKIKQEKREVKEEPLDSLSFLTQPKKQTENLSFLSKTKTANEGTALYSTPTKPARPSTIHKYLPMSVSFMEDEDVFEGSPVNLSDESDEEIRQQLEESRSLLESLPSQEQYKTYLEQFDPLPRKYVDELIRDTKGLFDHKYGVRHNMKEDSFFIGDSRITFDGKDIIVKGLKYRGATGLFELLFKKQPIGYKAKDLDDYMDILGRTNTYRKNYKENQQIHGTSSNKYVTIIHPYLVEKDIIKEPLRGRIRSFSKPPPPATRSRTGSVPQSSNVQEYFQKLRKKGGGMMMDLSSNKIDYVYFDNPNELVERLKLLMASKMAGHTGHNNEINSIIEELKEADIII